MCAACWKYYGKAEELVLSVLWDKGANWSGNDAGSGGVKILVRGNFWKRGSQKKKRQVMAIVLILGREVI